MDTDLATLDEPANKLPAKSDKNVSEEPSIGTLAWLQLQEHVEVDGVELPTCHRVPEGSTFAVERDGRCRLVRPDGRRCKATATRRYGVCLVHAGGGGAHDIAAMSRKGREAKARLKARRSLLGIGTHRSADPRQVARLRALERAEEIAEALVDGPLDDADLSAFARQTAVLRTLDATFPLAQVTLDVELPAEPAEVAGMGWQQMQALAQRVLDVEE